MPLEAHRDADPWALLRGAAELARRGALDGDGPLLLGADGRLQAADAEQSRAHAVLLWRRVDGWTAGPAVPAPWRALFDLYLPVCNAGAGHPLTVGHLGQSLDGYIATGTGDSDYVTGAANIVHLHRMRALCDAVVIGAETVASDNPRLTTRRVPGPNPLRVILDPQRRLHGDYHVFGDGEAPTLLVSSAKATSAKPRPEQVETIAVDERDGRLRLDVLLGVLHDRGCAAVFVEGGGATVSSFLEADLLDRLQLAVAPLLIGCGRPGIRLRERARLRDCLRPAHRCFAMGSDILFDCDLRLAAGDAGDPDAIRRIC